MINNIDEAIETSDKEFKQRLAKFLRNEVIPNLSKQEKQGKIYVPNEGYKTMDLFYKDIVARLENKD